MLIVISSISIYIKFKCKGVFGYFKSAQTAGEQIKDRTESSEIYRNLWKNRKK